MNQQNQNKQKLALTIIENIIRTKGIQQIVEDYKTAYFKILIESFVEQTKPTVEKFFFNSKITPLKVLWLIKLMYEKEKLKVPEKTKAFLQSLIKIIEYGRIKQQKDAFSMFDRDKYLQRVFEQIVQKAKKNQSQKLKDFLKNFVNHHKYSNAINLLFVVEKTYHRNLNNHFSHMKSVTLKDFNALSKATHFIVESLKNRMFGKKSRVFNLLKINSQKKRQNQAGLQRFKLFHEIHQKKNAKKAFNDILRYSISKNNSIIETEAKIFLKMKNLEQIISMNQLKSKIQAIKAFQDQIKDNKKQKKKLLKKLFLRQLQKKKNLFQNLANLRNKNKINKALFLKKLGDKLSSNFKKHAITELKHCQSQIDLKLFKNYLQKWKDNNITVKALNRKNYQLKKEQFLQKLKKNFSKLETNIKILQKKQLRSTLNEIAKQTSKEQEIVDQNTVIQNTLILSNLLNYLNKKKKIDKFLALYKWRENAKKEGTFRYVKQKNELNESEIQFEYLPDYNYGQIDVDIFKQQKQKIFLTMLEYIFLKRKATGMRAIALEANRIKYKELLKIFRLMIREIQMKNEMYFWRRLKANLNKQKIQERKQKLNLQKKTVYKSFKKIQNLF